MASAHKQLSRRLQGCSYEAFSTIAWLQCTGSAGKDIQVQRRLQQLCQHPFFMICSTHDQISVCSSAPPAATTALGRQA